MPWSFCWSTICWIATQGPLASLSGEYCRGKYYYILIKDHGSFQGRWFLSVKQSHDASIRQRNGILRTWENHSPSGLIKETGMSLYKLTMGKAFTACGVKDFLLEATYGQGLTGTVGKQTCQWTWWQQTAGTPTILSNWRLKDIFGYSAAFVQHTRKKTFLIISCREFL